MSDPVLPARARVVVVGGGIIGCSVAYHLAHMGWKDVVLLERDRLTSGTTWHAAGLMVTFGSTSETSTEMRKYTRDLYARLEAETGQSTGLQAGRLHRGRGRRRIASRSTAASPRSTGYCGVDVHEISPREVKELFPLAARRRHPRRLLRRRRTAAPIRSTSPMALAKGARLQGATLIEDVAVTGVLKRARRRSPA